MTGRPNRGTGVPSDPTRQTANGFDKRAPEFVEQNLAHLVHGARSPRAIAAMSEVVHEQLLEVAPWCDRPHLLPSVNRYLEAAAREALLHSHITAVSDEKGIGAVPSRLWEQATAATRLAHMIAGDLGLTPMGEERLRATAGHAALAENAVDRLTSNGAEILRATEARLAAEAGEPIELGTGDADD